MTFPKLVAAIVAGILIAGAVGWVTVDALTTTDAERREQAEAELDEQLEQVEQIGRDVEEQAERDQAAEDRAVYEECLASGVDRIVCDQGPGVP